MLFRTFEIRYECLTIGSDPDERYMYAMGMRLLEVFPSCHSILCRQTQILGTNSDKRLDTGDGSAKYET